MRQLSDFSIPVTEGDVRQLCGAAIFARGDELQRAGNVLNPVASKNTLSSEVMGTFRRADLVTVTASGTRLQSSCSCHYGQLCRHAAALLLQLVRKPETFAAEPAPNSDIDDLDSELEIETPVQQVMETPLQELTQLLERDANNHLRLIVRRRHLQVSARNKAELVEQLVPLLAEPKNIDAALAGLNDAERLMLYLVDTLAATSSATLPLLTAAYRQLGHPKGAGAGMQAALTTLVDLGLVMETGPQAYTVPRLVATRIPSAGVLGLEPYSQTTEGTSGRATGFKLGLVEVFQVVAYEVAGRRIGNELPTVPSEEVDVLPPGWQRDPRSPADKRGAWYGQRDILLAPYTAPLLVADLRLLVERTGQSVGMITFAVQLMLVFGILEYIAEPPRYRLGIRQDRLQTLLAMQPMDRLNHMVGAWSAMIGAIELGRATDEKSGLQLHYRTSYYAGWARPEPRSSAVRHLIARIIGRLPPEKRYDVRSLRDLLWKISPPFLTPEQETRGPTWWFTDKRRSNRTLKLTEREDWNRVWGSLTAAILTGPMTWLGLIDLVVEKGELRAFQVHPEASVLIGRLPSVGVVREQPLQRQEAPPLIVEVDRPDGLPRVLVPAGTPDQTIHTLLASIGELAEVSPGGLRYRLTPQRAQRMFDDGHTGPEIVRALEERAGGSLPDAARSVLAEWWERYGAIRLYDDLTLLELGDEVLLRELLVTSSMGEALVHTISPRLVAVDPGMTDQLIAELTRLGHTPRVVEAI